MFAFFSFLFTLERSREPEAEWIGVPGSTPSPPRAYPEGYSNLHYHPLKIFVADLKNNFIDFLIE